MAFGILTLRSKPHRTAARILSKSIEGGKYTGNGNNTLILVTADHSHAVSVVGTVNDDAPGTEMRNKVGTYAEAGFPNYPAPDAEG